MAFTFDPDKHLYELDGVRLPSVTQILGKELGMFYPVGPYRVRGQRVHLACELCDNGEDFECGEEISPYLLAWRNFNTDYETKWSVIEEQMYDPELLVAGTVDRIGTVLGKTAVVDLKSGRPGRETALQLAAYTKMAFPPIKWTTTHRYKVELRDNGTYRAVLYLEPYDFVAWPAFVTTYKWKGIRT